MYFYLATSALGEQAAAHGGGAGLTPSRDFPNSGAKHPTSCAKHPTSRAKHPNFEAKAFDSLEIFSENSEQVPNILGHAPSSLERLLRPAEPPIVLRGAKCRVCVGGA